MECKLVIVAPVPTISLFSILGRVDTPNWTSKLLANILEIVPTPVMLIFLPSTSSYTISPLTFKSPAIDTPAPMFKSLSI